MSDSSLNVCINLLENGYLLRLAPDPCRQSDAYLIGKDQWVAKDMNELMELLTKLIVPLDKALIMHKQEKERHGW